MFTLTPVTKDYIWGGQRLPREYGIGSGNVAEAWMCSFVPGSESTVFGAPVSGVFTRAQWGSACRAFKEFPVLIKLIDAAKDLSVQVHPSDAYARSKGFTFGKTEMWYIIDAAPDAFIYLGFARDTSRDECKEAIEQGTFVQLLHKIPVQKGQSYFVPAGTVHAIGAGCLIAEVQQTGDLTYRVFDYNRVGADGKPRQLHIEDALNVLDYSAYAPTEFQGCLAACPNFTVRKVHACADENVFSYTHLLIVEGEGTLCGNSAKKGDSFLIGAGEPYELCGDVTAICTTTLGR